MTAPPAYDLILRGGLVFDGTGVPGRRADIAITGARIAALLPAGAPAAAAAEIDAGGRAVAPGFIDVHTHDDHAVLSDPDMTAKLSQGVTTVVVGNCGISLSPLAGGPATLPPPLNLLGRRDAWRYPSLAAYAAAVNGAGCRVNVAALVGHMTLRLAAMDDLARPARAAEVQAMAAALKDGLEAGAVGFSTGLYYKPNAAATTEEVIAVAKVLAGMGGLYVTHMRNEHDRVLDSLQETFTIGRAVPAPVVISHHKCAGPDNWGRSAETLPVIDKARRDQGIGLDAYPYAAGSTVLDPDMVDERIRIMVSWSRSHPDMAGRDLAAIAQGWGVSQTEAAQRLAPAGAIYFQMDESDVRRILAFPPTMIGSDGLPHDRHPHPRLWGTFPRVLGHYSREVGLFPLEQAVHKMTGLSAATFNLADRGVIRPGAAADLVIFNPDTVADTATFEDPCRPAEGIDRVLVAGRVSWQDGATVGAGQGRFLHRGVG